MHSNFHLLGYNRERGLYIRAKNKLYIDNYVSSQIKDYISPPSKVQIIMAPPVPLWKLAVATGPYVRFAGLSGAAAVILGAYGSHSKIMVAFLF